MAKLNKILESIENLKLTTEVALLENTEVTELVRAQSKLMINENINFIKNELTKGGILEDVQFMLKNAWTQALMEDISMDTFRNMIPTGEDVDKFAKNIYNTGKDFANENIPKYTSNEYNGMKTAADSLLSDTQGRHAAEMAALASKHANEVDGLKADIGSYQNSQAGLISTLGGNGAKLGVQADGVYADGVNKANQLAGQAQAAYGQAKDMANAIPGQAQAAYGQAKDMVNAIPGQAQAAYGQAQAAYDSGKAAVQAVPGQVAALGAKIGANVQGVYDGASQGLGAKLNADGSPMTNNQMAGIGAGSAAVAAGAGYGAHKLAQKVRRSNTFR